MIQLVTMGDPRSNLDFAADALVIKPVRESDLFDAIQTLVEREPRPTPNRAKSAHRQRRVLLVEDNAINQRVARAMLEELGCDVEVVGNGQLALARCGDAFDLVLMDCQMPVLDGYATARAWRLRAPSPRTPIVALTAHSIAGEREKCLAAGMDEYATKPFTLERLAELLARWVPASEGTPPARADAAEVAVAAEVVLDPSALDAIHKIDPEDDGFAASLIEEFVDRATRMLCDAREALERGECEPVASIAHQLKSNCAQLGAKRAAGAAASLESAARAGANATALAPALDALDAALRGVIPLLLDAALRFRNQRT